MPKETTPTATYFRRKKEGERSVAYDNEFRAMLWENLGIIKTVMSLAEKAESEYAPSNIHIGDLECQWNKKSKAWEVIKLENIVLERPEPVVKYIRGRNAYFKKGEPKVDPATELKITVLGKSNRVLGGSEEFYSDKTKEKKPKRIDITTYFEIEFEGEKFFVKKSLATNNRGNKEFENTAKARKILEGLDFVTVVEMQFGYSNGKQSWFISKWKNLETDGFVSIDAFQRETPNDYGKLIHHEHKVMYAGKEEEVEKKIEEIKRRLKEGGVEIIDLDVNLFYNPVTEKFFLLDITTKDSGALNQPKEEK